MAMRGGGGVVAARSHHHMLVKTHFAKPRPHRDESGASCRGSFEEIYSQLRLMACDTNEQPGHDVDDHEMLQMTLSWRVQLVCLPQKNRCFFF